jgi:hypothetical protein
VAPAASAVGACIRGPIMKVSFWGFGLLAACMFSFAARAEADGPELGIDAGAGYRHDSNVNIASTDTNTGEADNALLLKLGIDGAVPLSDKLSLELGYGYTSTTYATFSGFDLAVHHARAALRNKGAGFDSALSLDRFAARVDGGHFLDIHQASPSLSRLVGRKLYLRGSFTWASKNFAGKPERDASNNAVRGDAYILIDGMERYVAFVYRIEREDAKVGEFDYRGTEAKMAYGQRLQAGRMKLDWKMHLLVENRNYAKGPEPDSPPRRDERLRAGMSAAIPLSERIALKGEFEYGRNESNFAATNFNELVYSIGVAATFNSGRPARVVR